MAMGRSRALVVEVLGPLRVRDLDGVDRTPTGPLQRRLLALLVLRRGRTLSADAAIDALWPSAAPRDPPAALQNQLSRMRRLLTDGAIASVPGGYRLDPNAVDVDAERLVELLSAQRSDGVAAELAAMLDRWRGPAYPELDEVDEGRHEAARLEELRLRAREELAAARLARGDGATAIADLSALVHDEPLRERPRSLLLDALHATGRTAEALRVYDDFRRRLAEELGIEPSPALSAQHAAILAGTAPIQAARVRAARLPVPLTSILGRDPLLAEIVDAVDDHRLVTLVGPGGVGKTRLLLEVGHRVAARGRDPVVLCELSQVVDAAVAEHVASSLGIDARPGVATATRIVEVIGDSEVVLLLDNCEHVLDAVAALVELVLGRCRGVAVVATSRERLRLPGELVCHVPTLPAGEGDDSGTALFLERAGAVRAHVGATTPERALVTHIVRRLDGLPLAIELAAARLHTHDLAEIAAGLDERFSLLSRGARTATRHGSLEAAVLWSFELLDPALQAVLAELSVFVTPFTPADAAAVCALPAARARASIDELVERSLVMRSPAGRFVLLETIRAFAAGRLGARDDVDRVRERHALRMVARAEDADRRMHVAGNDVLTELDEAVGEMHTALGWLLDHGLVDEAGRLVAALVTYAVQRARPDVLGWAERVADADPGRTSSLASQVLAARSYAVWMTGDVAGAGRWATEAVEVAERAGVPLPPVSATVRGNYDLFEGRLPEAASWYRRGVASATDPGERLIAAGALTLALGYARDPAVVTMSDELLAEVGTTTSGVAAYVWYCAGEADLAFDVERARTRLARAVELAEATNASFPRGVAGASKASIEARIGDPAVAAADYRWLITHWRRAGMWSVQWTMLRSIAALLARLGRHEAAAVLVGAIDATAAGHRIFGDDEVALAELREQLSAQMGEEQFLAAHRRGAVLDGEAAAEHALASL